MISDECQNLVACMQEYQVETKHPAKDMSMCEVFAGNLEYFDEEE